MRTLVESMNANHCDDAIFLVTNSYCTVVDSLVEATRDLTPATKLYGKYTRHLFADNLFTPCVIIGNSNCLVKKYSFDSHHPVSFS